MLSTLKRNIILKNTQEWMEGRITIYQVAKHAKCKWETAQTYLHQFAPMITAKEQEIVDKLTKIDDSVDKSGIWQKIKTRIWSRILTEQSATPTPK